MAEEQKKGRFQPKTPVQLDPPKDDPISLEHLSKCDGQNEGYPTLVAMKGKVFDVSKNTGMYGPNGGYKIFAGKDASRALALSSLQPADVVPEWFDLPADKRQVLHDWETFFTARYNIVGRVEGATNTDADFERYEAGQQGGQEQATGQEAAGDATAVGKPVDGPADGSNL